MLPKSILFLVPVLALPLTVSAADQATNYETVREIAKRDPKVRAAYEAADRKLAERIVEIDPTLKGYVPGRGTTRPAPAAKPAPAPTPKPKAPTAPARRDSAVYQRSYVVAKGDTLATIAAKHNVTVAELRAANSITNDKKLPVGQVLAIPNGSGKAQPARKPAAKPAATTAKPKEKSWWETVKSGM